MVWERERGKEGTCVESSTGWREVAPLELGRLEPQGTMVTNPQGLSPCDADCPWGPKEVQEGSEQKSFLLEPRDGFWHICSERENWRKRGALSYFFVPSTSWLQGTKPFLVAKMTRIEDPRWEETVGGREWDRQRAAGAPAAPAHLPGPRHLTVTVRGGQPSGLVGVHGGRHGFLVLAGPGRRDCGGSRSRGGPGPWHG